MRRGWQRSPAPRSLNPGSQLSKCPAIRHGRSSHREALSCSAPDNSLTIGTLRTSGSANARRRQNLPMSAEPITRSALSEAGAAKSSGNVPNAGSHGSRSQPVRSRCCLSTSTTALILNCRRQQLDGAFWPEGEWRIRAAEPCLSASPASSEGISAGVLSAWAGPGLSLA